MRDVIGTHVLRDPKLQDLDCRVTVKGGVADVQAVKDGEDSPAEKELAFFFS